MLLGLRYVCQVKMSAKKNHFKTYIKTELPYNALSVPMSVINLFFVIDAQLRKKYWLL